MANKNIDQDLLKCPQCELSILGTFFKSPMTYMSFIDVVQNSDFSDGSTRFWHIFVDKYILTYSNEITPALLNTFASMDTTRLQGYRKFGGYNTIKAMMDIALDEQGLMNAIQTLKKYSLVRNLAKDGFDVENIIGNNKFSSMNAEDVASLVQGKLDIICNSSIVNINKSSDMAKDVGGLVDSFFTAPSMGLKTPFNFLNEHTLGLCERTSLFWGSRTNQGKGRSLINVACYLAMVEDARVSILENEMDLRRMNQAFFVTACNASFAQKLTGCKLHIPEKRLVTASYLDKTTGMPLYRHQKDGEYTETVEQYKARIERCSDEYHMVKEVANYLETKVLNKVLFKNISNNYEDSALLRHFNTSALVEGANVIIYDTLKNAPTSNRGSDIGSWSQLVNTATMLQETTAKLKDVTSIMSFQLDREAYKKRIEELSESNIAGASSIMHVADSMVMFLHIAKEDYKDYRILKQCDEWGKGETIEVELDPKKNYSAFRVMKTRNNSKGTIYVTETDLNRNTWDEISGELIVKNPRSIGSWKK